MTKQKKTFFRETNLWRIAGFFLVIGGLFLPIDPVTWGDFSMHANFVQILGGALVAYPMIIEVLKTVFNRGSAGQ